MVLTQDADEVTSIHSEAVGWLFYRPHDCLVQTPKEVLAPRKTRSEREIACSSTFFGWAYGAGCSRRLGSGVVWRIDALSRLAVLHLDVVEINHLISVTSAGYRSNIKSPPVGWACSRRYSGLQAERHMAG